MVEIDKIPLDDIGVYLMLARGDVHGVFQLDSYGGRRTVRDLRPKCFEDIAVAISLDRPGPLESGAYDLYMQRRRNPNVSTQEWDSIPEIATILRDTHGVILYQEQVLQIAQFAGYSAGEADEFRAAMGKKKPEQMKAQRTKFIKGSKGKLTLEQATKLFDQITHYAGYAFNRSHAIGYALIAYQCAWLKYHYPVHWYCALLNERRDEQTKLKETIKEVRSKGIPFLGADIYKSKDMYVVEGNAIRVGLTGLQDFGQVAYNELQSTLSKNGHYTTLIDIVRSSHMAKLNSKAMTALIKAGAMDSLGDRQALLQELPKAIDQKRREQHERFKEAQAAKGLTLAGTPRKRINAKAPVSL